MHNELGQPHEEPKPNLPKKDNKSFIVPWNFKQHVMDTYPAELSDSERAIRIIQDGKAADLLRELKQFQNLDRIVAHHFISKDLSGKMVKNIGSFNPAEHKAIALDLIESGESDLLLSRNLGRNFQGLDEEVFNLLVQRAEERFTSDILNPELLAQYGVDANTAIVKMIPVNRTIPLENVTGLTQETALILLNKPTAYLVNIIKHTNSFILSPEELDHLIEKNFVQYRLGQRNGFIIPLLQELTKPESQNSFPETTKAAVAFGKPFLLEMPTIGSIETVLGLLKTIEPEAKNLHPWEDSIQQLEKLQAHATNTEHDPWVTDLHPLIEYLKQRNLLSFSKPEDGKMLVEFVKRFGMSNIPLIARTFFEINKNGLGIMADYLGEFLGKKIEPGSKDKSLLNELEQKQRWVLSELLRDEVPKELETKIGLELLNLIKGSTRWSQKDTPEQLIARWKKTATEHPELTKLPEHYVEYKIEVPVVDRRVKTEAEEKDLETKQQEILALSTTNNDGVRTLTELGVFTDRLLEALSHTLGFRHQAWPKRCLELADEIYPDFNVEEKLAERKAVLLDKEITGDRLEKALEAAQRAFVVQKEKGQALRSALAETVYPKTENYGIDEPEDIFVAFMESLAKILPKGSATDKLFLPLSMQHWDRIKTQKERWNQLNEITKGIEVDEDSFTATEFNPNAFLEFEKFFTGFVSEHYLQPNQDPKHTGHIPFSPELLKALESAWTRTGKNSKKDHLFVKMADKLKALERGDTEETGKTKKISLVPAKGVMRIFSGDTGDACYTSQHEELAEGKYPDMTAYSFVTNRGTASERVQGSVLFIETIQNPDYAGDDAGKKVLLIRANNPRENLLSQVDANKLVQETINVAIDLAKQRGIDIVAVPNDKTSESNSNRPDVTKYYKQIASWHKVPLTNTPETNFNGYNNWDPDGSHPCVIVWRKEIVE